MERRAWTHRGALALLLAGGILITGCSGTGTTTDSAGDRGVAGSAGPAGGKRAPATAAEISASLSGAGTAKTLYIRSLVEVCDSDTDNHAVAGEYYRSAPPSTLLTQWVKSGFYTCASSSQASNVIKLRVREQQISGEDRFGSWKY
ncbi:hypothetical protein [Streptomyces sp. S584]|uniref:hypothetical protein n=1 Tax=Streptomyces sp. S584 TaxID=3096010 RepID=UPI002AFFD961|nr:hypothetical protein [Streptomyces sp. S584]